MTLVALATLAAAAIVPSPARATAEARVTIRIVAAARLRVGADRSEDGMRLTNATIRGEGGRPQAAKLLEFQ